MIEECRRIVEDDGYESRYVQRGSGTGQMFGIRDGVVVSFYSSEAPCLESSQAHGRERMADGGQAVMGRWRY